MTDPGLSDAIPVTAGRSDAVDTMLERICRSLGCVSLGQPDVGCSLWSSPHGIHLAVVFEEATAIQRVGEGGRLRDVLLARLEVRSRDDLTCLLVVPDARNWRALERAVVVRRAAEHLRVVTTGALTALAELVHSGALTDRQALQVLRPSSPFADAVVAAIATAAFGAARAQALLSQPPPAPASDTSGETATGPATAHRGSTPAASSRP